MEEVATLPLSNGLTLRKGCCQYQLVVGNGRLYTVQEQTLVNYMALKNATVAMQQSAKPVSQIFWDIGKM